MTGVFALRIASPVVSGLSEIPQPSMQMRHALEAVFAIVNGVD